MKKYALVVLILSISILLVPEVFATGGTFIEPDVASSIENPSGKTLSVIVSMRDKVDFRVVNGNSAVVSRALRKLARDSQKNLIDFLTSRSQRGVNITYRSIWAANALVVEAPDTIIREIAGRDDISAIYSNKIVKLEPEQPASEQIGEGECIWSLEIMGVPEVWRRYGLKGKGVVVGHIDTGAESTHPDLKGKILLFKNFITSQQGPGFDDQGHGTHTAGTIAGGNASGKYIGVAPECRLIVAKVFDGNGSTTTDAIMRAMQWMLDPDDNPNTDDAPRLVSNSWGSSSQSKTYWDIIEAWRAARIFPCFAAGNSGPGASTMGCPGGYPVALGVGATDKNDKIASFSSRGPITWDGVSMIKPDVSAPGADVYSAIPGGKWGTKSGTSMACPNVAGLIALMYQADPNLTVTDVQRLLEATAVDLGKPGRDNDYGSGRVNALMVIQAIIDGGKVRGVVTDAVTNRAVPATIEFEGAAKIQAGPDGSFSAALIKGEYKVRAVAFGYLTHEGTVTIRQGETLVYNIKMEPSPKVSFNGRVTEKGTGNGVLAKLYFTGVELPEFMTDASSGFFDTKVPAGTYKVNVLARGYRLVRKDVTIGAAGLTMNFELDKLPPVLVVSESKDDYSKYYSEALQATGIQFMSMSASEGITYDILAQYPLVIWYTGKSSSVLPDSSRSALAKFLDGGGNLFITGQDIGYSIKETEFYGKYMKARYIADSAKDKSVKGVLTPFEGFASPITGAPGANNQSYPDVIEARAGAELVFKYGDDTGAGVLVKESTYTLLYLGFGFEGIQTPQAQAELMKKALSILLPKFEDRTSRLNALEKRVNGFEEGLRAKNYAENMLEEALADIDRGDFNKARTLIDKAKDGGEAWQFIYRELEKKLMLKVLDENSSEARKILEMIE